MFLGTIAQAQFTTGPVIQNPVNGGATPIDADFLAIGEVTTVGELNSVGSLTLDAGLLTLDTDHVLQILSGGVLVQANGSGSTITGGTLELASAAESSMPQATFCSPREFTAPASRKRALAC